MGVRLSVIPALLLLVCVFSLALLFGGTDGSFRRETSAVGAPPSAVRPGAERRGGAARILVAVFCVERSGSTWCVLSIGPDPPPP